MNYPGLVSIGRLGGKDSLGFHHVMIKPEYRSVFSGLDEIYLIFNSDRVFYVTICERKLSDRKTWIKLREDGIEAERKRHREAIIAISSSGVEDEDDELDGILGFQVLFGERILGVVEDYFYNGAQQVLSVTGETRVEYLIPWVDYYIATVNTELRRVTLQNAEELIHFYQTEAE